MSDPLLQRIPVVGGCAYIERIRRMPTSMTVTLRPERDNRCFPHAIAVVARGEKVGYVAPEVARRYHAPLAALLEPVTCMARRGSAIDHETSGVEWLLDFGELPVQPLP